MSGVRSTEVGAAIEVVLDRPDKGNALDLTTAQELESAFLEARETVRARRHRAVVLRAEGPRFCVGGDLAAFAAAPDGAALNEKVARPLHHVVELIEELSVPVVAAIQGATGGGGVGLVLACDLVVTTDSAFFRLGYTGSGLSPDCGVTWELPHRGPALASDLVLTNRKVPAAEALGLGLVSRVVAADGLDTEVADIVEGLTCIPIDTIAESKRLLRAAVGRSRHAQLEDEAVTIGRIGDTADARETMTAFLERRPPRLGEARSEA